MVVLALICSAAAAAQNAESYVDTNAPLGNACTRTAPCQNFAEAIAKTNDGGEIRVLTIGNYGPFTVTNKNITVDGFGLGYITVNTLGQDGITINNTTQIVIIRNLTLSSQQFAPAVTSGNNGITFNNGAGLVLQDCTISGWGNIGVSFQPAASVLSGGFGQRFWVQDTTFHQNKTSGVTLKGAPPATLLTEPAKYVQASFDNAKFEGNGVALGNGTGLQVLDWVIATVNRSNLNSNALGIQLLPNFGGGVIATNNGHFRGSANVNLDTTSVSNSLVFGIVVGTGANTSAVLRMNDSKLWDSGAIDLTNFGGASKIESYGNNKIGGSFLAPQAPNTILPQQ